MSSLFSIIIPTYNRPDLLQRAIKSVIAQSYTNWELIIIDDGSEADVPPSLNDVADARIRYFRQENQGKSAARNRGIELAKGTYICFLDDDDVYLEDHLSTVASLVTPSEYPVVAIRSEAYRQVGKRRTALAEMPSGAAGIRFVWRHGASPFFFALHRDILDQFRFDTRFPFAQDVHLLIRVLLHYPVLHTGQRTLVLMEHPQRSSHAVDLIDLQKNLNSRLTVIEDLEAQYGDLLASLLTRTDYLQAHSRAYLIAANQAFRLGAFRQAWEYNTKALTLQASWPNCGQTLRNLLYCFKRPGQ